MENIVVVALNLSPLKTTMTEKYVNLNHYDKIQLYFRDTIIRRTIKWLLFGIVVSIVVITAIVVPVTIIMTSGTNTSTTNGKLSVSSRHTEFYTYSL